MKELEAALDREDTGWKKLWHAGLVLHGDVPASEASVSIAAAYLDQIVGHDMTHLYFAHVPSFPGRKRGNYWHPASCNRQSNSRWHWGWLELFALKCVHSTCQIAYKRWVLLRCQRCDDSRSGGPSGDLIDKAKSRITEIQVTLDATADEDRKKKEEERRRHLRRAEKLHAIHRMHAEISWKRTNWTHAVYIYIYMYTCLTGIKTISHVWRELFPVYLSYLDFDLDPPPHLLKLAFSG